MDPNGGKNNLSNKLSKEEAIARLEKESFKRITVSFYKYVHITDINFFRNELYNKWFSLNIFGRIYLANEGINAQISIPEDNLNNFIASLSSEVYLKNIPFKIAVEDNGKSFYKLTIKIRKKIVADGLSANEYDVTNVGNHMTALEWNRAINNGATVIDMRNHYESEIGKFKGALCPEVETFKQELPVVKEILKGKESEKLLLYCTGGIRCEKASAYLKNYGFKDVNQLHGGIIDYVRQVKANPSIENKFIGKNFVFDARLSERITDDVISNCHQCGKKCDNHINCKNVNCNLLFLQCLECKVKYKSCCSIECIETSQLSDTKRKELRKGKTNKNIFHSHKKVKLNIKKIIA